MSNDELDVDQALSIRPSLPLLLVTTLLLVGAAVIHSMSPWFGPPNFPLWGLLLVLGIVAAIGTIVSLFFATDDEPEHGPEVTPGDAGSKAIASSRGAGEGFGRPLPDSVVRPNASSASSSTVAAIGKPADPWDEDLLPRVPARGPRPVLTTLEDPGDIGRALEEIAEIQRQLAGRPASARNGADAPARA